MLLMDVDQNEKIFFGGKMENFDLLKIGLSNYGLNPNDWNVVPTLGDRYLIIHREDPEIHFLGLTTTEPTYRWHELVLPEL